MEPDPETTGMRCPFPHAKRAGRVGVKLAFVFFIVKGLLWLLLPALAWIAAKG